MSNEQFYRPLRSVPVSGNSWESVEGQPLPTKAIPILDGHIPSLCRFVVDSHSRPQTSPQLIQISPAEKRTSEVRFGETDRVIFEDEFHNLFGCFDLKGAKSIVISARLMKHAPSGFAFWGIQEADSIARGVVASNYLRSEKIETEIILKVMEPTQIPYKNALYSPEDFKTQLVKDTLEKARRPRRKHQVPIEQVPNLCLALEGMEFILTFRGKQVNERLIDLEDAPPEAFREMIERAFWFYNFRGVKESTTDKPFTPLDPNNPEDIHKYFQELLPDAIGDNYGEMHKAGCIHVHPHLQNISLLGGIYDTDSVKGAPLGLGDQEITKANVVNEMHRLLYGYWNQNEGKGLMGFMEKLIKQDKIPNIDRGFAQSIFEYKLLISYIFARGWNKNLLANIDTIYEILNHVNRPIMSLAAKSILSLLNKTDQWKYEFELENTDEVAGEMFKSNAEFWQRKLKSPDDTGLMTVIMSETLNTGKSILKARAYSKGPIAFDCVEVSHGEDAKEALLDLVAMDLSFHFMIALVEELFTKYKGDPTFAKEYILGKIS